MKTAISKRTEETAIPMGWGWNWKMGYWVRLIFSKVQEFETETAWFLFSPFRVELLDEKESV
jgi:hypothetical protein